MTRWRSWACWRRVVDAAEDATSSATRRARTLAGALLELLDALDPFDADALVDAVDLVARAHPTSAPVLNLRNLVYLGIAGDPDVLRKEISAAGRRLEAAPERLGLVGLDIIRDESTVLVHSVSSSVRAMLETCRQHGVRFQVVCSDTSPDWPARDFAHELSADGFDVEVLALEDAIEWVAGMDAVLVGADAIGPGRMINKIGTGRLAEAAADAHVATHVVATTDKIVAEELFEATRDRIRADVMELVPLSWFTSIVTDDGVLTPGDVARLATEQTVARALR